MNTFKCLIIGALLLLTGCDSEIFSEITEVVDTAKEIVDAAHDLTNTFDQWQANVNVEEPLSDSSDIPTDFSTFAIEVVEQANHVDYVEINDNVPYFLNGEISNFPVETYEPLDALGRVGETLASVSQDIMPTEERESISHVYPSGWEQEKYEHVEGKYLYNRSHLIGFQLAGENDNDRNLMTGTRQFNVEGMLPFEDMVADYVHETNNTVLYRVTPIFHKSELVARGVVMEAYSVEDDGFLTFNVFVPNVQDGIEINYETGVSRLK